MLRGILTTLAEVAGICLVSAGCWLICPALGLIAGGAALIVIGVTQA